MIGKFRGYFHFTWCALAVFLAACASQSIRTLPHERYLTNYQEVTLFGDSLDELTDERLAGFALLTDKLPTAWGRYVCRKSGNFDSTELDVFRRHSIHPILILQPGQDSMNGSESDGRSAAQCLERTLDALRLKGGEDVLPKDYITVYLDVEQGTLLSSAYLFGVVMTLQQDGLLNGSSVFGVYVNARDAGRLAGTVNDVIAHQGHIAGVWYARYLSNVPCAPVSFWEEHNAASPTQIRVPIELWQYAENCHAYGAPYERFGFDLNSNKPPVHQEQRDMVAVLSRVQ